MKGKNVDIYVYVQGGGADVMPALQEKLDRLAGVIKAGINHHVRHLLAVEYNPDRVSSQVILKAIRNQGCNASLVGM